MAPRATLAKVIKAFVDAGLADTYTAIPALIIAYEPAVQRAQVQPVIRGRQEIPALDRVIPDPLPQPIIPNVPVVWPGGAAGGLTVPLLPGDTCTLVFAHRSTDEWRATGLPDNIAQHGRRHDLTDAICIPGGRSFNSAAPTGPLGPAAVDAAGVAVVLHALSLLRLGGNTAVDPVIKGAIFTGHLTTFLTSTAAATTAPQIATAAGVFLAALGPHLSTKVFTE